MGDGGNEAGGEVGREMATRQSGGVDPYEGWATDRRECPVRIMDLGAMRLAQVVRRDDVEAVLKDEETFSATINQETMGPYMGSVLLGKDGREHTVYRNLVSHAFRRSAIERWEDELVGPTIRALIEKIRPLGAADLVTEVTSRYPVQVIAGLIGVPVEDVPQFAVWAEQISSGPLDPENGAVASRAMREYLTPFVEDRKKAPREDLISDIVTAEIDGERLDDEHIYGFLRLLMPAGAETTYRAMGNALVALLRAPDILERVRIDPSLLPRVIEETLRWQTSIALVSRVATRDTEVAGCPVEKGTMMGLIVASANHDEQHFPDPETWDLDRPADPGHLAFGWGRHLCLGMHLARMELRIGLQTVIEGLPGLRLDPSAPPPEVSGYAFRGPESLRVLYDAGPNEGDPS